ncbi:MAG TPA: sulfotransferase domain-containing protein [Bacteroidia bacterium]|nr:sulfotransferase domain-containing protein [Bacteroidia bacterium]
MGDVRSKYIPIVAMIWIMLPYTLIKQRLFFRLRKSPKDLPDFMCIGTQKSGTTWLYSQLEEQPEVFMAKPKEIHYFDWFFYRSLNWYATHFRGGEKRLRGEVTPGYSIIEKGRVRFMKRIMPDLKLILLLRDPRERAWSSARFHFGKQMGRDLSKVTNEEFIHHFNQKWVKDRGDYETIWKKWTSVFDRSQFLVVFAEEIESAPEMAIKKCSDFLGVKFVPGKNLQARPNESQAMEMPVEIRKYLDEFYLPMISRMPQWLDMENKYWNV